MLRQVSLSLIAAFTFLAQVTPQLCAQNSLPNASAEDRALARSIFEELIEINTTDTPRGNVTAATTAMEKRFLDAGFARQDIQLLGPDPPQAEPSCENACGRNADCEAHFVPLPHGRG